MTSHSHSPSELREAAARLAAVLHIEGSTEYRLGVLKRLVRRLGDDGYPTFLKLVMIIAESDDEIAKKALSDAFVFALSRLDVPSGQLSSWGASRLGDRTATQERRPGTMPRRQLGPIEFLTAWYAQRTQLPQLDEARYTEVLAALIELCNYNPDLRRLYSAKLLADSRNELEGAYTRVTCDALAAIAQAWTEDAKPRDIAHAAIAHRAVAEVVPRGWILRDL